MALVWLGRASHARSLIFWQGAVPGRAACLQLKGPAVLHCRLPRAVLGAMRVSVLLWGQAQEPLSNGPSKLEKAE